MATSPPRSARSAGAEAARGSGRTKDYMHFSSNGHCRRPRVRAAPSPGASSNASSGAPRSAAPSRCQRIAPGGITPSARLRCSSGDVTTVTGRPRRSTCDGRSRRSQRDTRRGSVEMTISSNAPLFTTCRTASSGSSPSATMPLTGAPAARSSSGSASSRVQSAWSLDPASGTRSEDDPIVYLYSRQTGEPPAPVCRVTRVPELKLHRSGSLRSRWRRSKDAMTTSGPGVPGVTA